MFVVIWIWWTLQNGDAANLSIYIHSEPRFVFDETTTSSAFFYGRQLINSIQVYMPLANLLW